MNEFVVALTNENVEKRFREIGLPVPGDPPPSVMTVARIHGWLQGNLLIVHHASKGAWLRNPGNAMSHFVPIWKS